MQPVLKAILVREQIQKEEIILNQVVFLLLGVPAIMRDQELLLKAQAVQIPAIHSQKQLQAIINRIVPVQHIIKVQVPEVHPEVTELLLLQNQAAVVQVHRQEVIVVITAEVAEVVGLHRLEVQEVLAAAQVVVQDLQVVLHRQVEDNKPGP